jgi:hypothetical protein
VAPAMTICPGCARVCRRAARLGVSPTTACSCAEPSPVARAAIVEAAAQFQKGLDQLALLPDNPERQRQELGLCSSLSAALRAAKGQAAPETGEAYARANVLWERLGFPPEFVQIPYGKSRYHSHRCEFGLAQLLDEDLLRLSQETTRPALFWATCPPG